jgi:tRNA-dihydrouridine synthase
MVTARALIERRPETLRMIVPGKDEWPRSVQLYSVDPTTMRAAVTMLGKENLADHIDMNFGCPVPKVTRKGGGAALPLSANFSPALLAQPLKPRSLLEFR